MKYQRLDGRFLNKVGDIKVSKFYPHLLLVLNERSIFIDWYGDIRIGQVCGYVKDVRSSHLIYRKVKK